MIRRVEIIFDFVPGTFSEQISRMILVPGIRLEICYFSECMFWGRNDFQFCSRNNLGTDFQNESCSRNQIGNMLFFRVNVLRQK